VRAAFVGFALLLAACATGEAPGGSASPGGEEGDTAPARERVLPHERYLKHATRVEADEVYVILPAQYAGDLQVSGLSAGWRAVGANRVWEGGGDCELRCLALVIFTKSLTVTVVPDQEEQVVHINATGHVSYVHSVRGSADVGRDLDFLFITNDGRKEG